MVKIRRKRRVLRSGKNVIMSKSDDMPTPTYSTASTRIIQMPAFKNILEHLRKGTSVASIVAWCEKEAWLGDMSPSTLTQYLYKFKTECAHMLESGAEAAETYDYYVGNSIPEVDPEQELDKLIALQKRRLALETHTEITMGKLFNTTVKEVVAMGDLLKLKAGINGETSVARVGAGDSSALRELQVNEAENDKLQNLTERLIKEFRYVETSKEKANRSKAKTVKSQSR